MKKLFLPLLVCTAVASCSQPSKYKGSVVPPAEITKDLMSWLYYQRDYMAWSSDYETLDVSSRTITKGEFLHRLTTGAYLPLRIKTSDSSLCYQLFKLDNTEDKAIGNTIKDKAQLIYRYFKMEGKPLPGLNFTDLNGDVYDAHTTKGKTVVLNCWFIRCKPCNEEMPRLNELVKQFENREDIVFLGLALMGQKT